MSTERFKRYASNLVGLKRYLALVGIKKGTTSRIAHNNLILSNLKSIVQTILIGVVYSISALVRWCISRSGDNIKVHIFDRLTCLVAQFGRANCYLRWHVDTSSRELAVFNQLTDW